MAFSLVRGVEVPQAYGPLLRPVANFSAGEAEVHDGAPFSEGEGAYDAAQATNTAPEA